MLYRTVWGKYLSTQKLGWNRYVAMSTTKTATVATATSFWFAVSEIFGISILIYSPHAFKIYRNLFAFRFHWITKNNHSDKQKSDPTT